MQFSNIFVIIYCTGIVVSFLLKQWLAYSDFLFRRKHGRDIPGEFTPYVTREDLDASCAYHDAKYKASVPEACVLTAFDVFLMFSGFYPAVFTWLWSQSGNVYITTLLFALAASLPGAIVSLPFELYDEFVLEKRFGFSVMTVRLWIQDQIKSVIISGIVGIFLLSAMTLLFEHVTGWWWMLGTVYVVFSLLVSFVYPRFIAPLFNKFTPLEDGVLKDRVTGYLERSGFKSSGVFIMDASKRSSHSNAYFTGFGKTKRVVLYDTLVKQLTVDELGAVLGHELGHYRKHHIIKRLCVMIPLVYIVLFAVSRFIDVRQLYAGFGFAPDQPAFPHMKFIGLFLLGETFGNYGIFAEFIGNVFSRRDEYQADAYAAGLCGSGKPLITALIKLNKENKSELQPSKAYSMFMYSHPTLPERVHALS